MRLERDRPRESILEDLRVDASRTWGAERAALLGVPLEATATSLWRLAQTPLELLELEPDFLRGAAQPQEDV
jgi:hypothetical protein